MSYYLKIPEDSKMEEKIYPMKYLYTHKSRP